MKRMRMIALLALASLALLLTAAACSDDEDDDTGDAATTTEASADSASDDGAADDSASEDDADGDADDAAEDADADDAAGDDSSADATAPAAGTITGSISEFTFAIPTQATVGTTIDWTNDDEFPHTVTQKDGGFDSGSIVVGGTFSHTLDAVGTVDIFCTIHPFMTATIEVVEG